MGLGPYPPPFFLLPRHKGPVSLITWTVMNPSSPTQKTPLTNKPKRSNVLMSLTTTTTLVDIQMRMSRRTFLFRTFLHPHSKFFLFLTISYAFVCPTTNMFSVKTISLSFKKTYLFSVLHICITLYIKKNFNIDIQRSGK